MRESWWFLVIAVPLIVLPFIFWMTASASEGSINISKGDYQAALDRWRAQRIAGYEIVVGYGRKGCGLVERMICGTWTLRVRGAGIEIVEYKWINEQITRDLDVQPDDLRFLTVEGLFSAVDNLLTDRPFKYKVSIGENSHEGFPLDYKVQFDPQMGYPTLIRRDGRENDSERSSIVGHVWEHKEVLSLKVLK